MLNLPILIIDFWAPSPFIKVPSLLNFQKVSSTSCYPRVCLSLTNLLTATVVTLYHSIFSIQTDQTQQILCELQKQAHSRQELSVWLRPRVRGRRCGHVCVWSERQFVLLWSRYLLLCLLPWCTHVLQRHQKQPVLWSVQSK